MTKEEAVTKLMTELEKGWKSGEKEGWLSSDEVEEYFKLKSFNAETEAAMLEAVYTYDVDAPTEADPATDEPELTARFRGIRYWTPEEFRCQCYGKYCSGFPALPDRTLLELVDDIRHRAGRPGHRSSGLRCQTHNDLQPGSVPNSKHRTGKALDFMIEGMTGAQLLALAQADPRTSYAYIIGSGPYVHVDVE